MIERVGVFFLFFFQITSVAAQDTSHYVQSNSPWVSSNFYFYKQSKTSAKGLFEKKMYSDDGQSWTGRGRFIEYRNKIVLKSFQVVRTVCNDTMITIDSFRSKCSVVDSSLVPSIIFHKKGNILYVKGKHGTRTKFLKIDLPISR